MKTFVFLLVVVAMSSASDKVNVVDNVEQVNVVDSADQVQVAIPPQDGGVLEIINPLDPAFGVPSATYPGAQYPSAGNGLYYPPPSYYDRGSVSGQDVPKYQVKPPGWDKKYSFPGARGGSADSTNE